MVGVVKRGFGGRRWGVEEGHVFVQGFRVCWPLDGGYVAQNILNIYELVSYKGPSENS